MLCTKENIKKRRKKVSKKEKTRENKKEYGQGNPSFVLNEDVKNLFNEYYSIRVCLKFYPKKKKEKKKSIS